jgi:hypothetical protein
VADEIKEYFSKVKLLVHEDPTTEYLFLIGGESEEKEISCWYSLDFRAENGPRAQRFRPVGKAKRTAA